MRYATNTARLNYWILALLALVLAGCSGLGSEPPVVATVIWPTSTPNVTTAPTTQGTVQPTAQQTREATAISAAAAGVIGSVSGQVTNASKGGTVPPDTTVTLHLFEMNGNEQTFTAPIDAQGNFTFNDVPMREDYSYVATTTYAGRNISREFTAGDPAVKTITLPITLYESTADTSVLSITSFTTRINATKDVMEVAQVIRLRNSSDRMFSAETGTTDSSGNKQYASVSFALPKGAQLMGFSDNTGRFVVAPDSSKITDTMPVLPNTDHVVHYIYVMPYDEESTVLVQNIPYTFNGTAQLMVSPATLTITTGLPDQGIQSQGDSTFRLFGGSVTFKPLDNLEYIVSGAVPTTDTTTTSTTTTASSAGLSRDLIVGLLIGGGFGFVVLGLILLLWERRKLANTRYNVVEAAEADDPRIAHLVAQLAQLDERHDRGTINENAYQQKRARLKSQLAQMMNQ